MALCRCCLVVLVHCHLLLGWTFISFSTISYFLYFFLSFKVEFFIKSLLKVCNSCMLYADAAKPWQLGFQDPSTPTMEGIIRFHTDLMFLLILITAFVGWMMFRCI